MNYERAGPGITSRTQPPALPPRASRPPASQVPRLSLELERPDWYWGNISREEVSEKLNGQPDGTFLVRDSHTTSGEYTLCLRWGGKNKLIRIFCLRGRFGFSESCQFDSVVKLIDHYRRESLRDYNEKLDVRLERPLVESRRFDGHDTPGLIDMLRETHDDYDNLASELDDLEHSISALSTSIANYRKAQEAYGEVYGMFRDQVCIAQKIRAELHERDQVRDNKSRLEIQKEKVQHRQLQVGEKIHEQTAVLRTMERRQGTVNQEERQLLQSIRDLEHELQRRGVPHDRLKLLLDGDGDGAAGADYTPLSEQEYRWFLTACDRSSAEAVLGGKPDGTFLIRHRQDTPGAYVLSIRALGHVEHCVIYQSKHGYGFSMPYAIHSSLKSLVDHYHTGSELSDFNEKLPERLMYPALDCQL